MVFIIGSDAFSKIDSWYRWEELLSLVDFIVMKRLNHPLPRNKKVLDLIDKSALKDLFKKRKKKSIFELDLIPVMISSSLVRQNISERRGVGHLVNSSVEEYLRENNLYESKNSA